MSRPVPLTCSRLEPREVPAAGLFADLRPGVWGSYPQHLTASGDTLFFAAETTAGMELWATDGSPAGTRLVKDVRPGGAGSNPSNVFAAGGGVVYFGADDGGGRTLWRSDGTAAGTWKATGIPDQLHTLFEQRWAEGYNAIGWKGELYFDLHDAFTGGRVWAKTDGRGVTPLASFPPGVGPTEPRVVGDRLRVQVRSDVGPVSVWETDGTWAGTRMVQGNLTAPDGAALDPGAEVAPGRFVFLTTPDNGSKASVWVGGGTAGRQLVKAFDASPYTLYAEGLVAAGGKAYFTVNSNSLPRPADVALWVTDGTPAGTRKLDVPTVEGLLPRVLGTFDGRAVVQGYTRAGGTVSSVFLLTDGTPAGTTPIPRPAGAESTAFTFAGTLPPDAAHPRGLMLFQAAGQTYRTDGTPAGTALIDRTGLPDLPPQSVAVGDGHLLVPGKDEPSYSRRTAGAYFNGAVYYAGKTATARPELWRWEMAPAATPNTTPAPAVTGTTVNDGSAQRSMVKTLTVTFDSAVSVHPAGVTITSSTGRVVTFGQQLATASGVTTLTLTFPDGVGGSIADGRYTLKIAAGAVTAKTGGAAMAADYTFGFTRLYGDTSGDGVYDRDTRMLVKALLGQEEGDPGYRLDLDVNGDGKIDATDELAAVRNWGKAV